jgi:hypothetical protein
MQKLRDIINVLISLVLISFILNSLYRIAVFFLANHQAM